MKTILYMLFLPIIIPFKILGFIGKCLFANDLINWMDKN